MLAVWGRAWSLCWRSWAALEAYVGGPGRSGAEMWPKPERETASGGRSLGAYLGDLGLLLGPMLAVLGRSWGYVGGLGRSWGLSWRSWVALGGYVGGLGPKNAKNIATLKMCLFLERERDLRPGGRS